jgi:hypothetical protein
MQINETRFQFAPHLVRRTGGFRQGYGAPWRLTLFEIANYLLVNRSALTQNERS